jgi:23S rRNA (uracil1939-C5)-methyltransferase
VVELPPIVELELTDLAYGGDAVGRYHGLAIFVPYGIAGERVRAAITEERRGYARARLLEVLQPAPERVTPPYPELGESGGFQWQHIAYDAQLVWKARIVRELLVRVGKFVDPPVQPTLGMPPEADPWRYRTVAQFAVAQDGAIGFRRTSSHDVIDMPQCPLVHPALDAVYQEVRQWLLQRWGNTACRYLERFSIRIAAAAQLGAGIVLPPNRRPALVTIEATTQPSGLGTSEWQQVIPDLMEQATTVVGVTVVRGAGVRGRLTIGQDHLVEHILGRRFRISTESFFQVNAVQTPVLAQHTIEQLQPQRRDMALDGYSGVGLFSVFLAQRVAHVTAVESHPVAVTDAQVNINLNNLTNVTVLDGTLERIIGQLAYRGQRFDLAIVDPPRAGCHPRALQGLLNIRPRAIAYVSCDPSTLARDLAMLRNGGFSLVNVQPIDMFPQTVHIETVSLLRR